MKLSTRGRYSTRLMLELALRFNNGPVLLKDISAAQEISLKYLGQLIIPLKIAKLIKSTRGSHGGYFLSRSPDNIILGDILTAVEGPLNLSECIEYPDICARSGKCVARDIWKKASFQFHETVNSITLGDMVKSHKEKN